MKFFFDANISPKLVQILKTLTEIHESKERHVFVHHSEKFTDPEIDDEAWIRELGEERGWIIISADPHISRNPLEKAAWQESRLTAFFFRDGFSNSNIYDQGADLLSRWREIMMLAKNSEPGSGYLIPKKQEVKVIFRPTSP